MLDAAEMTGNGNHSIDAVRQDWDRSEAEALYMTCRFADLMFQAQSIHAP